MKEDGKTFKDDPLTGAPYKHTALMSLAGKLWKEMDEASKAPYEKLAEKDKERHTKQKAEYDEKGYYTNADGSKSNAEAKAATKETSKSKSPVVKKLSQKARLSKEK